MEINKYIDHTNLNMTATVKDIEKLCEEAKKYKFSSVCVNPCYVELASKLLDKTDVDVCTVIGFPLGANKSITKEYEAIAAIEDGATEIDMVINVGALKDKDYEYVKHEIESIRDAIDGHILKVIIETGYLTDEEIIKAVQICNETYVNFVKTSTGFGKRGVNMHDIELINENKSELLEIKASGGIKTQEFIEELLDNGVTRIGTSKAIELIEGSDK
ncbi:MAG: deoxyribose-phosphate aldolase [Clostridium sp.]|nr:deoxyribose-phosphate aldolase [Clostridium sp.]MCM1444625.1 deoxyribose-phosphate aldolase [Candidatus Amulumruptor caecigallinarius]